MEIAVFIQNIQEERAEVALYIFLNNSNANFSMSEVLSNNNRWRSTRTIGELTKIFSVWAYKKDLVKLIEPWKKFLLGQM